LLPSLPGGLSLSFTLDGDTVAEAGVESATASAEALLYGPASGLVERLSGLDPLSPVSYRLLASLALQDASEGERRRLAVLEVERAASHLGWLSGFAHLNGLEPVRREAARLELRLRRLPVDHLEHEHVSGDLLEAADRLARGIDRTPLLSRRLYGVGVLEARDTEMGGPVARAAGRREDLRLESADYEALGFEPVLAEGSDALSRMRVRLAELQQSLYLARDALRRATGSGLAPAYDAASGSGSAAVETPRGPATLWISIEGGEVVEAELIVPAQAALALAESVAEGRELGDALVGVASLDISPWGAG
jgi:Ni,Fe-hydrogenase III large subunit